MNLWLDDVRPAPEGWVHVKTIEVAKEMILTGEVEDCSIDNDLGTGPMCEACFEDGCIFRDGDGCTNGRDLTVCRCHVLLPEGYKLVDWMEETGHWPKNKPTVHSKNTVRATYMRRVIDRHYKEK